MSAFVASTIAKGNEAMSSNHYRKPTCIARARFSGSSEAYHPGRTDESLAERHICVISVSRALALTSSASISRTWVANDELRIAAVHRWSDIVATRLQCAHSPFRRRRHNKLCARFEPSAYQLRHPLRDKILERVPKSALRSVKKT